MSKPSLRGRVVDAAQHLLAEQRYVAFVDVLARLGWVHPVNLEDWRKGRIDSLDELLPVDADRLIQACEYLVTWANELGLQPKEVEYRAASRNRPYLRFFAGTTVQNERVLRTHWFSADSESAEREQIIEREGKAPDLVVVIPRRQWACEICGESGEFLIMEDGGPSCLDCADLGHLVFLPAGDAALTRRAKKASGLWAVVVRWSPARKRYERQGILVEESAREQAEQLCLDDADVRERRRERDCERRERGDEVFQAELAAEILRLFPGCPPERSESIARYASRRGSGRIGRSAAGQALDERAVTLAVVASARHIDTDYDALLMRGVERADARGRVARDIDRLLEQWRSGG